MAIIFGRKSISVALATEKDIRDAEAVLVAAINAGRRPVVEKVVDGAGAGEAVARTVHVRQGAASRVERALKLRHRNQVEERPRLLRVVGEMSESTRVEGEVAVRVRVRVRV